MSTSSEEPLINLYEKMTHSDTYMMEHDQDEPPTQRDREGPCHFLGLSREIRDMIYEQVLLVDFEIEPYPPAFAAINAADDDSDITELKLHHLPALLLVNKFIGAEARSMLYARNTWRVPNWGALENENIFRTHPNHFQNIVMPFHQLDLPGSVIARAAKREHSSVPYNVNDVDSARARAVHQQISWESARLWQKSWALLSWYIKNMKQLKTITIDIEELACPGGCCRSKLFRRAGCFHQAFLKHLRPKKLPKYAEKGRLMPKVFVRGLLNEEERKLVCEDLNMVEAP